MVAAEFVMRDMCGVLHVDLPLAGNVSRQVGLACFTQCMEEWLVVCLMEWVAATWSQPVSIQSVTYASMSTKVSGGCIGKSNTVL